MLPSHEEQDDDPLFPADSDDLSLTEIEEAYLRALETADAADAMFPDSLDNGIAPADTNDSVPAEAVAESTSAAEPQPNAVDDPRPDLSETVELDSSTPTTVAQVIEALLFVSDHPTPAKRIGETLGGSNGPEEVDQEIRSLNARYESEGRPYEIHLVEGGYVMSLRKAFEPVRERVYGQGPKEVKLNQDALEVLAFIAYRQPATRQQIEETGKERAGGFIRQLLRRQLIQLVRGNDSSEDAYTTTPRFLDLFGLASTEDLPHAEDFSFK
ncbi:SMC-Scp complex subunit ScpB [Thalassoglobus sp. JC818]|uniref:SMC-Scp complex subunit ScpB n=1 Tax=Thalassoglobus sp. JC818 TaxID=3232136 RepID=UPI00345961C4